MTFGQRVAQKRKELGLSQEGLGERLGVSRQAIYKWEADAAMPEIDKLITLSRLFGVSVGWLLGEERRENAPEETGGETILIQGIIDVYFEEDGELVVLDYKTDKVKRAEDLKEKYHAQLEYYAEALELLLGKKVKEKLIYSFTLGEEIQV